MTELATVTAAHDTDEQLGHLVHRHPSTRPVRLAALDAALDVFNLAGQVAGPPAMTPAEALAYVGSHTPGLHYTVADAVDHEAVDDTTDDGEPDQAPAAGNTGSRPVNNDEARTALTTTRLHLVAHAVTSNGAGVYHLVRTRYRGAQTTDATETTMASIVLTRADHPDGAELAIHLHEDALETADVTERRHITDICRDIRDDYEAALGYTSARGFDQLVFALLATAGATVMSDHDTLFLPAGADDLLDQIERFVGAFTLRDDGLPSLTSAPLFDRNQVQDAINDKAEQQLKGRIDYLRQDLDQATAGDVPASRHLELQRQLHSIHSATGFYDGLLPADTYKKLLDQVNKLSDRLAAITQPATASA